MYILSHLTAFDSPVVALAFILGIVTGVVVSLAIAVRRSR